MNTARTKLLNQFSQLLGWGDLTRFTHVIPFPLTQPQKSRLIVWYEAGDCELDCILQVNLRPTRAAIYALRYGICTGWHEFRCTSPQTVWMEARRLRPILGAACLETPQSRRDYRIRYPRFCGYTWERIRREGEPGACTKAARTGITAAVSV